MDNLKQECKLCDNIISDKNFKVIDDATKEILDILLLKVNFEATPNPVICIKCYDAVHVHSTFIKNCMDVEDNKSGDAKNCGEMFLNDQSKMVETEIKSEETDEKRLLEIVCDIKKEEHDEWDTSFQSQSDLMHTEESKSLYGLDDREQTTVANCQFEECIFKSTSESQTAGHEHGHKRASEAQANKSDRTNRSSLRRCLTKALKGQEYKCDKCTYNTKYRSNFMQHQLIHKDPSEVKMFKCDKCTFETKHKGNLIKHYLIHKDPAEVRMFKCECGYKSKQKGHLKQHQLIHKDPSEVQMYECNECPYRSIQKNNLKQHQLRHKDPAQVKMFKCDKCTYETKRKRNLNTHCLRHSDLSEVQMFECGECDYRTIDKRSLRRHQLRHRDSSEVQMFKCNKCKFTTKYKGSLVRHYSRHKHPSVP